MASPSAHVDTNADRDVARSPDGEAAAKRAKGDTWTKVPTWCRHIWVAFHAVILFDFKTGTWPTIEEVTTEVFKSTQNAVGPQTVAIIMKVRRRSGKNRKVGLRTYDLLCDDARSNSGCTTANQLRDWVRALFEKAMGDKTFMDMAVR